MFSTVSAMDTAPVSLTSKALNQNFTLEEKERREEAAKNKDFYYGKQDQGLILANEDVDPVILNLTRPIMHKRTSMLYSRPLKRDFIGPASSVKVLEQVYKDNSIDALLGKADLLAELTGSCLVHPAPDPSLKSGMRLVLYDASSFTSTGNDLDPSTADAISLLRIVDHLVDITQQLGGVGGQPQVERVIEQQIWTAMTVSYFQGSHMGPQMISTEEHGLGFLPFVNFRGEEVHDQYIGFPNATNIVRMNAQMNQMLTHLCYMIKMQAFTPIVLSGYKKTDSIVWTPGNILTIPLEAAAQALKLDPKIEETLKTLQWFEDRLYISSSVPKISVEGGEGATSGRELLIRWFPLMQVFQEKCVRFHRYELQLANMILALMSMPFIDDIEIDYPEDRILPFSPDDEDIERNISLNLTNIIEELIRRNPQLDEAEAQKQLKENIRINQENSNGETQTGGPNNPTDSGPGLPGSGRRGR